MSADATSKLRRRGRHSAGTEDDIVNRRARCLGSVRTVVIESRKRRISALGFTVASRAVNGERPRQRQEIGELASAADRSRLQMSSNAAMSPSFSTDIISQMESKEWLKADENIRRPKGVTDIAQRPMLAAERCRLTKPEISKRVSTSDTLRPGKPTAWAIFREGTDASDSCKRKERIRKPDSVNPTAPMFRWRAAISDCSLSTSATNAPIRFSSPSESRRALASKAPRAGA